MQITAAGAVLWLAPSFWALPTGAAGVHEAMDVMAGALSPVQGTNLAVQRQEPDTTLRVTLHENLTMSMIGGETDLSLGRVAGKLSGRLRLSSSVCCGAVAIIQAARHPAFSVVLAAVGVLVVWSLRLWKVGGRGPLPLSVVTGDVAVTAGLSMALPWIVLPGALGEGVGWLTPVTTVTFVIIALRLPWYAAVAVTSPLAALHIAMAASVAGWASMVPLAVTFGLQIGLTCVVMVLMKRATTQADTLILSAASAQSAALLAENLLREETEYRRTMHNHAIAALATIGEGVLPVSIHRLRQQCGSDLDRLRQSLRQCQSHPPAVDLVPAVRSVVSDFDGLLHVHVTGPRALIVAGDVAEAFTDSSRQALVNVSRHAATSTVSLDIHCPSANTAEVVISDRGRGFAAAGIPQHSMGIRLSIIEHMHSVGGAAEVQSTPGKGTTVKLRWPA